MKSGQFIASRIDARNGAFGLIPDELDGAVVTNDFPVFEPDKSKLHVPFLGWMSKTATFVDLCKAASEGTTNRVRLKEDQFLRTAVSLPPLAEQRRIVARIEELAAKIAEARRLQREAALASEALLGAAIAGALSQHTPTGHLADVLTEPPRNGWSARCDNADGGVAVLSLGAVTGFDYRPTHFKRTSEATSASARYWLRDGDLLITRSNTPELVGHAAIYNGIPSPCIYPDLMMRLMVNQAKADPRFVHLWLRSPIARDYVRENAKGTSPTMKKISQGIVMRLPFPDLPLSEQLRILSQVDMLSAEVAMITQVQTIAGAELDALLPSILDKAFQGTL